MFLEYRNIVTKEMGVKAIASAMGHLRGVGGIFLGR
jgi:hypothetical protein